MRPQHPGLIALALLGAFCAFLLSVGEDLDAPPSGGPQESAAFLLSQTVHADEAEAALWTREVAAPPAPAPRPAPSSAALPAPRAQRVDVTEEAVRAAEIEADAPARTADREEAEETETAAAPARKAGRVVWALVTAYCPCSRCCGGFADGRTSTGTSAWRRGVAADPRAIPYGTAVYVHGYGRAVVDDSGVAMRRSWRRRGRLHLDLRMTYHWQARRWGRRHMKIRIYDR